jgi:hypothetical protein
MSFRPYRVVPRKSKPPLTSEALDVAARYFLYKLHDGPARAPVWVTAVSVRAEPLAHHPLPSDVLEHDGNLRAVPPRP